MLDSLFCWMSTFSANTVTAVCSVFIAVAAFFATIWQILTTRKHNRLSVKPHLVFGIIAHTKTPRLRIILSNNGLGPAIIKSFTVHFEKEILRDFRLSNWPSIMSRLGLLSEEAMFIVPDINCAIAVNEKMDLLRINSLIGEIKQSDLMDKARRINITIEYESIYGEAMPAEELNSDLK